GLFANPFDYDDAQNIMYSADNAASYRRWPDANILNASSVISVPLLSGQASAVKVSPYTTNRVFLGSTNGRVIRLDNANATPTVTNISGAGFPAGYINSVNVGSNDNYLVAVFTNFGVNNVWTSTDGGTNWTAIDGNLPDMPVRWALFDPSNNNRMMLATETGIWNTDLINGASTVWTANPGFPTTRVSMIRIRTSDRTVVAATYGRGLFTGVWSASLLPEVNFVAPTSEVTEETVGTIGCRGYKDFNVNVGIINAPTGNATVTYTVQAGGTATQGVDYDFTTNGDFTTPSTTHTFLSGALDMKAITIRIYDDASVESPEDFTIKLAVSGTTDAVAGTVSSHTVTINDNDRLPIAYSTADYQIGTYNIDLASLTTPFDGTKLKHRLQVLYTVNELKAAGILLGGTINAATLRVKTKNTVRPFQGFTVSIGSSGNTTLGAGFAPEALTTVFTSANYNTVAGNNTFTFSTPFAWDGNSNIVIQYCYDNISYGTPDNLIDIVEGNTAPLGATIRGSTYSNWTTAPATGCALAAAFVNDARANVIFNATFGDQVATALNNTKTEFFGSGSDLYFYSNTTGELMARLLNLSTQNYGCTQITIDRAGTGTTPFWNNNAANYLMNKTFRIVPTTNSTTGKYEVTFYFTAAEKTGWETATGQSWNDIQIIKVPSQIKNVTPALPQPDGAGTVQVIPTVKRTFGSYYTLSAVFDNGFSGYGFGVPGRMNMTLVLTGVVNQNTIDIDLTWTTSAEVNSTIFEVEKSYDGITFHKIGTVSASGNKLTPSSYPFTDHENVMVNHYRIKMLHSDGTIIYSNVVILTKPYIGQQPYVLSNPFYNTLQVRLALVPVGPVILSLFDDAGKLVKKVVDNSGSMLYTINTSNIMSRAIYMLRVDANGKKFTIRVMKR
ncbi:MAG TPA: T9SS type A sorting domain-containing protein, partial [Ferruginibacter sp.]|nr:T9SS type A sorting domain-containing protein [Ferruginibacter sp.]